MMCKTCKEDLIKINGQITHYGIHDTSNEIYPIKGCGNMVIVSGIEEENIKLNEMKYYFDSHPEIKDGYKNWLQFHNKRT